MNIPNAKVYFDGSSYIAIAPKVGKKGKRSTPYEPLLQVIAPVEKPQGHKDNTTAETTDIDRPSSAQRTILITPKELFEKLYKANLNKNRKDRKQAIIDGMKEHFKTLQDCIDYVNKNIQRKDHNKLSKKLRICRKVNNCINDWNFFVTFTYDSEKHTEETFRKKLSTCLSHLSSRKGWKYIGVWERSPEKQRLHFHGLFAIPDGTMPGEIIEVNDWDSRRHTRQITHQNTYFNERFGRSDFREIEDNYFAIRDAVKYIIKYIEKSGERIVYSKGLYSYFRSDITDDDIICQYGISDENYPCDNKYILAHDFKCHDEGVYLGKVSPEVIARLPKSN